MVTGEWRRLHNENLYNLSSSPNIIQMIKTKITKVAGHVARMGKRSGVYSVLVGKPEEKRPLERSKRKRQNNIRTDLQAGGYGHGLD